MPNAATAGGASRTDEARALVLPVRINVKGLLSGGITFEKQTFCYVWVTGHPPRAKMSIDVWDLRPIEQGANGSLCSAALAIKGVTIL